MNESQPARRVYSSTGFTLVELMAATLILAVILLIVFHIIGQTSDAWKNSADKIESFQGARAAFETISRRLSQASLNTYYDYFDSSGKSRTQNPTGFIPAKYGRNSELHFVSGKALVTGNNNAPRQITHSIFFQAPTGHGENPNARGLDYTLNGCGYFIQYAGDSSRPGFISKPGDKYRYRLMEFLQPSDKLTVYTDPIETPFRWFLEPLSSSQPPIHQLAANVVAMVILPKRSKKDAARFSDPSEGELAPAYEYNSKAANPPILPQPVTENQLPPLVEIVLVAVDESSFARLGNSSEAPSKVQSALDQLFQERKMLEEDLDSLTKVLNADQPNLTSNSTRMKYQIFRTEIPIRSAKWSE